MSRNNLIEDDEDDEPVLGFYGSLFWLAVLCGLIAVLSDYLVDGIDGAAHDLNWSQTFLTAIIIPNVNNAPEHAVAFILARKGKINAALSISTISSAQLATFCMPVAVLWAWALDEPLSFQYPKIEAMAMLSAILLAGFTLATGRSTWISGVTLIFGYLLLAACLYVIPVSEPVLPRGWANISQDLLQEAIQAHTESGFFRRDDLDLD